MISNISVDEDAQPFETPRKKNYSVNAPGAQILLGYGDAKLFEYPRINNHTAPSAQILLGDDESQSFDLPPPLKITVLLQQVTIFF